MHIVLSLLLYRVDLVTCRHPTVRPLHSGGSSLPRCRTITNIGVAPQSESNSVVLKYFALPGAEIETIKVPNTTGDDILADTEIVLTCSIILRTILYLVSGLAASYLLEAERLQQLSLSQDSETALLASESSTPQHSAVMSYFKM